MWKGGAWLQVLQFVRPPPLSGCEAPPATLGGRSQSTPANSFTFRGEEPVCLQGLCLCPPVRPLKAVCLACSPPPGGGGHKATARAEPRTSIYGCCGSVAAMPAAVSTPPPFKLQVTTQPPTKYLLYITYIYTY